jgi:hypothetical protein
VAPALIAFFFAGLSTLTTSYFMKLGLLLAPAVVLSVLPVGALIFYWFSIVAVARIIKPLWWLFGRPNSVVFERKDSAVQPAVLHNGPPTAASPTSTPSTSSAYAQERLLINHPTMNSNGDRQP